jgi:hypothetical protein
MADLDFIERNVIDRLLISSGYVLDFSNRIFEEFLAIALSKRIDLEAVLLYKARALAEQGNFNKLVIEM